MGDPTSKADAAQKPVSAQILKSTVYQAGDILTYVRHSLRGNKIVKKSFYRKLEADNTPVLIIHGFLGTRGAMYPLERRLNHDRFNVFSFNLGMFNIDDVTRSAERINAKIEHIIRLVNLPRIDVIGHSLGGLIGLYYIKKCQGHKRVRKLITMGTPYFGTWAGLMGVVTLGWLARSTWQMLPGSQFLIDLHQGKLPETVKIYSIYARNDWLCPPETTRLPGARLIEVPYGHASLVTSKHIYSTIKGILEG